MSPVYLTESGTVSPTVPIPSDFLPFGSTYGDSTVPRGDDEATAEIQLIGADVVIFGSRRNSLYVSHKDYGHPQHHNMTCLSFLLLYSANDTGEH